MTVIDPTTGEIVDNPTQAKELWSQATEHEKEAKKIKDALKPFVKDLVKDGDYTFNDGYVFKEVNSQSFAVDPREAWDTAASYFGETMGADGRQAGTLTLLDILKPDAIDLKKLSELAEAGEIHQELASRIKDKKYPYQSRSYVKLERLKKNEKGD